jgi:intergrase/recombinase
MSTNITHIFIYWVIFFYIPKQSIHTENTRVQDLILIRLLIFIFLYSGKRVSFIKKIIKNVKSKQLKMYTKEVLYYRTNLKPRNYK